MYFNKEILILEDNLRVLSKILDKLYVLEGEQPYELSIVVVTNNQQVENYINRSINANFDLILLDRDEKLGYSFYNLNIERFGVDKIIAISSVPKYIEELKDKGVNKYVLKTMENLDEFTDKLIEIIRDNIKELPE